MKYRLWYGYGHFPGNWATGWPGCCEGKHSEFPFAIPLRTHHTNMDTAERVNIADIRQAALMMVAFAYDAAMAGQKMRALQLVWPRRVNKIKQDRRGLISLGITTLQE